MYTENLTWTPKPSSATNPLNLQTYQSPKQHSPTATLPLPLPVPSTCKHINHLATHSPTTTRTTAAPSPLNLQTYQSPKQHSPTATLPLPLPVPSTCRHINHSSSTHQLQHVPLPLPVPSTCKHINHLATHSPTTTRTTAAPSPLNLLTYQSLSQRTHQLQHYHCRSQSPQPANISLTQAALTNCNTTTAAPTPLNLQAYQSLKQHSPTATLPLPLPLPSSTLTLTAVSPQPRPPTPTLPGIPQLRLTRRMLSAPTVTLNYSLFATPLKLQRTPCAQLPQCSSTVLRAAVSAPYWRSVSATCLNVILTIATSLPIYAT
ncbi:hypothetical protein, conserved [Babesia bigemina]|uniref:Uncharacterized protein n=1 Tax=Babesia bigemina TaxID=5866 RepID=A0A061BM70_BABBI|nr:hypothetical protein, conserved [Babesia bigemina]CDR71961.1 hypothetical protein, conserved [Babesia bigemina]|eukprot:XP_012770903.1 hypothetical protein, conserved [Babesia bigemina]